MLTISWICCAFQAFFSWLSIVWENKMETQHFTNKFIISGVMFQAAEIHLSYVLEIYPFSGSLECGCQET